MEGKQEVKVFRIFLKCDKCGSDKLSALGVAVLGTPQRFECDECGGITTAACGRYPKIIYEPVRRVDSTDRWIPPIDMPVRGDSPKDLVDLKKRAKVFIDENVWDGEDRSGATLDMAHHNPDELQELIDTLVEHLYRV